GAEGSARASAFRPPRRTGRLPLRALRLDVREAKIARVPLPQEEVRAAQAHGRDRIRPEQDPGGASEVARRSLALASLERGWRRPGRRLARHPPWPIARRRWMSGRAMSIPRSASR